MPILKGRAQKWKSFPLILKIGAMWNECGCSASRPGHLTSRLRYVAVLVLLEITGCSVHVTIAPGLCSHCCSGNPDSAFSVYCWDTCCCQQYKSIGCCTTKTCNVNLFRRETVERTSVPSRKLPIFLSD